ncbi:MAG: hypothetical protein CL878_04330 [Dehalococcoidia bacterium]|nr:hypothetical protein [Dehalococcoidia bacterium]
MIRTFLRGLLALPLFILVVTLAVAYALQTTLLTPEYITARLAAAQLYDHLYDEVVDTVLSGEGLGGQTADQVQLSVGQLNNLLASKEVAEVLSLPPIATLTAGDSLEELLASGDVQTVLNEIPAVATLAAGGSLQDTQAGRELEAAVRQAVPVLATAVAKSQAPAAVSEGQDTPEAAEPPVVAILDAARLPVTTYLAGKVEGFAADLHDWMAEADAPVPMLDLTDLGELTERIEEELGRRDKLTLQIRAFLRLGISRVLPEDPLTLASTWDDDPDTHQEVERVRAAYRQLPFAVWVLAAGVGANALLILLLGSGFGGQLRGLGVALLPGVVAVGLLGVLMSISFDTWLSLLPIEWPPPGFAMSARLADASLALVSSVVGGVGEQLLLAAGVTFGVSVGLVVIGSLVRR